MKKEGKRFYIRTKDDNDIDSTIASHQGGGYNSLKEALCAVKEFLCMENGEYQIIEATFKILPKNAKVSK